MSNQGDAKDLNFVTTLVLPVSQASTTWNKAAAGSSLLGSDSNDKFSATGSATLAGGDGDDIYAVSTLSKSSTLVEDVNGGIDTVLSWVSYVLPTDQEIENLTLSGGGAIDATGNALNNLIIGNAANNVITGGAGDDVLTGSGGRDTFVVKAGAQVDVITDFAATGAGADLVRLDGYYYPDFTALKAAMVQAGNDVVVWLNATDTLVLKGVLLGSLTASNFEFSNVSAPPPPAIGTDLVGTDAAETLVGTASAEVIDGRAGADTLTGQAGNDTFVMTRGNGSDTITDFHAGLGAGDVVRIQNYGFKDFAAFKATATQVGNDLVVALGSGETLTFTNLALSTLSADDVQFDASLPGSGGSTSWFSPKTVGSTFTGTGGNDNIGAGVTDITLIGGKGDDIYTIGDQATRIVEKAGEGVDTVNVWTGNGYAMPEDQAIENGVLMGTANAWLTGNGLNNMLTGTSGDNILDGAAGNDILTGNGGSDRFMIARGEGSDVITDFSTGPVAGDRVSLAGTAFRSFADIRAALHQVGTDAVLDLGGGETLTLRNTAVGSLAAANFSLTIDPTAMVQTFADDFNTFSRRVEGSGNWTTRYVWDGDDAYFHASQNDQQVFVDPDFRGLPGKQATAPLGLNPFEIVNGELVVTSKPIDPSVQKYMGKQDFTSGMISSESSLNQTYGYFEMSVKLPAVTGMRPAFWMMPTDKTGNVEVDIFESLGGVTNSAHTQTHSNIVNDYRGAWVPVGDISEGQHTYGLLWTPSTLSFYVDGQEAYTTTTPQDMNRPMYMLATLGAGGVWGGATDPNATAQMTVDYIHVYQLPEYTLAGYTLQTSATPTNTVTGTTGADSLSGTVGADLVDGNGGTDSMSAGVGDDTYIVSSTTTAVYENFGWGTDTVKSWASFTLGSNLENLTLLGTGNLDATGNGMSNIIIGNAGNNTITGGAGNDILTGGGGNDVFVIGKNHGSDILTDFSAGPGAGDVVRFLSAPWNSFGDLKAAMTQAGADVYLKYSAYDTLVFRGHVIADFSADDFELAARPPYSDPSIKWFVGSATAKDSFYGTSANETFQGQGGGDIVAGGLGDDMYDVVVNKTSGVTTVIEKANEGIDTVRSWGDYALTDNVENLLMNSGSIGTGNAQANLITGSWGNDTINGKGGNDWLTGSKGNDTFIVEKGNGFDTITDFHAKSAGGTEVDTLKLAFYGPGTTLDHDGDLWAIHYAGGVEYLRLTGVTSLLASDYILS